MPKVVDKEAKKQIILQAALHEFAQNGVNQTKISNIAKRAGIGKGTVYEYYESKDAIFMDSMSYFMQMLERTVINALEGIDDPKRKIELLIRATTENAGQFQEFLTIILDFWAIGIRGEQFTAWREAYENFQKTISEILEEGISQGVFRKVNTKALAFSLIGLLDGILFQMVMFGKDYPVKDTVDTVIDNFLNGLLS